MTEVCFLFFVFGPPLNFLPCLNPRPTCLAANDIFFFLRSKSKEIKWLRWGFNFPCLLFLPDRDRVSLVFVLECGEI